MNAWQVKQATCMSGKWPPGSRWTTHKHEWLRYNLSTSFERWFNVFQYFNIMSATLTWFLVAYGLYTLHIHLVVCSTSSTSLYQTTSSSVNTNGWTADRYPNPRKDVWKCGRKGKASFVCDPDSVITYAQGTCNVVEKYTICYRFAFCLNTKLYTVIHAMAGT